MVGVASRFQMPERVHQKPAGERLARSYQTRDKLEVATGLLLRPRRAPGRHLLQAERGTVALSTWRVANVAAGVTGPPFQEDGLDAGLEKLKIKRRRRSGDRRFLRGRLRGTHHRKCRQTGE